MSQIISYWQYIDQNCPQLFDPRVNISQHMAWILPSGVSNYRGAEPDNYNFAVFDQQPRELKFIKEQCWYKVNQTHRRIRITGWMSVYVADCTEAATLFNREILKIQPQAVWRFPRAKPMRIKRTLIDRENIFRPKSDTNFTTEERLWQMGYYENLQNKYFNGDERFIKVVGTPRGCVLNYQQEVDNEKVEDF